MRMRKLMISLLISATLFISFEVCSRTLKIKSKKDMKVVKVLDLKQFNKLKLSMPAEVNIHQGETQKIVVTAPTDMSDLLDLSINNGQWEVGFKEKRNFTSKIIVLHIPEIKISKNMITLINYKVTIDITVPHLEGVIVSGSGDININDFVDEKSLHISLRGSGDVNLNGFQGSEDIDIDIHGSGDVVADQMTGFDNLGIEINGSGDVELKNTEVTNANIYTNGSGDCDCAGLMSKVSDIRISGSGGVDVQVEDELKVKIGGSGSVHYIGSPRVEMHIRGQWKCASNELSL